MKPRMVVVILCICVLCVIPVGAGFGQYDFSDATADLKILAQGMSDLLAPNLGSVTFLGDPTSMTTVRNFSLGVSGGTVLVPIENFDIPDSLDFDVSGFTYEPIPAIGA
jgi:hypothetical protein